MSLFAAVLPKVLPSPLYPLHTLNCNTKYDITPIKYVMLFECIKGDELYMICIQ